MQCRKCLQEKPIDEFALKDTQTGKRQTACKECHRQYSKGHYASNTGYYRQKAGPSRRLQATRNTAWLIAYLITHPCVDCGETDLDVLEFDHIDRHPDIRVTQLIGSRRLLEQEVAKCQVRCANCHARRTRKQLGTSRYK